MSIRGKFCEVGRLLEDWDQRGATVQATRVTDDHGIGGSGTLTAEVELWVSAAGAGGDGEQAVACTPDITADGSLTVALETGLTVPSAGEYDVDVSPVDARITLDGGIVVTARIEVAGTDDATEVAGESGPGEDQGIGRDSSPERAVVGEDEPQGTRTTDRADPRQSRNGSGAKDVPPFEDTDLLASVYESHDTFAEMAEALEMDVTGETVRRYMIDHGIHQPTSYGETRKTGVEPAANGNQQAAILSDGIGLPENITVEDVIETVNRSNTIYEVKEDLDLEREEAHEMLKDLNLIDLVLGRLSNDTNRDITREDVIERLREVSTAS